MKNLSPAFVSAARAFIAARDAGNTDAAKVALSAAIKAHK